MKKIIFIKLILIIAVFTSCSNDDDGKSLVLSGTYSEIQPYSGNHLLNFIDDQTLILSAQNSTDEEFIYQINDNLIKLNPTRDLSQTWELEINIINSLKFEIQNIFYPSIPENVNPLWFVTFEK